MKKIFKSRIGRMFVVLFVLGIGLLIFMIWGLHDANQKIGLKVNIPEIQNEDILKNIYFQNDSIIAESVLITYNEEKPDKTYYVLFKFINTKEISDIIYNDIPLINHPNINTERIFGFTLWGDLKSSNIISKYQYTTLPVSQKTLSDTIVIQNFEKTEIGISLTDNSKKDLGFKIEKPSTVVLYKRNTILYFIWVNRLYDTKNKWITEEELENTLYPLVKNWSVYEKR